MVESFAHEIFVSLSVRPRRAKRKESRMRWRSFHPKAMICPVQVEMLCNDNCLWRAGPRPNFFFEQSGHGGCRMKPEILADVFPSDSGIQDKDWRLYRTASQNDNFRANSNVDVSSITGSSRFNSPRCSL